jgi:hypothetical protein
MLRPWVLLNKAHLALVTSSSVQVVDSCRQPRRDSSILCQRLLVSRFKLVRLLQFVRLSI